jgi:hypothetical protein
MSDPIAAAGAVSALLAKTQSSVSLSGVSPSSQLVLSVQG